MKMDSVDNRTEEDEEDENLPSSKQSGKNNGSTSHHLPAKVCIEAEPTEQRFHETDHP